MADIRPEVLLRPQVQWLYLFSRATWIADAATGRGADEKLRAWLWQELAVMPVPTETQMCHLLCAEIQTEITRSDA